MGAILEGDDCKLGRKIAVKVMLDPNASAEQTQRFVQEAAVQFEKAECSNRGLCNRLTGQCECFTNYAGFSCSQQTVYV